MAAGQAVSTWEMAPEGESSPGPREVAVSVRDVGKMYYLYDRPQDRLKQALLWRFGKNYGRQFWALRDVSFEVRRGEALGIIGRNGSGKSTLLQIVAGIIPPTTGEVSVRGRVTSLLELGSGFNPEFTGRENVYLNGAILGFSRPEMDVRFDEIADFAEIGDFIDQPVKFYSSGMFVRLAFAVQACLEPEVLIVDEALSVGDIFFQQKCHARMEQLLARDTAILLVSHDMTVITKYSTRAMLLDQGQCLFLGGPEEAVNRYYNLSERARWREQAGHPPANGTAAGVDCSAPSEISDWPAPSVFLDLSQAVVIGTEDGVARCTGIALCNAQGDACSTFEVGETACFYYEFELLQDIKMPTGGVAITNALNLMVHSRNTLNYQLAGPPATPKGSRIRFRQTMELSLAPDEYTFGIGLGTISPEGLASVIQPPYDGVGVHDVVILRVRQAGKLVITRTRTPIRFHGYADLKGDCMWAILPPPAPQASRGGEQ